jgi:hypothetical protein
MALRLQAESAKVKTIGVFSKAAVVSHLSAAT